MWGQPRAQGIVGFVAANAPHVRVFVVHRHVPRILRQSLELLAHRRDKCLEKQPHIATFGFVRRAVAKTANAVQNNVPGVFVATATLVATPQRETLFKKESHAAGAVPAPELDLSQAETEGTAGRGGRCAAAAALLCAHAVLRHSQRLSLAAAFNRANSTVAPPASRARDGPVDLNEPTFWARSDVGRPASWRTLTRLGGGARPHALVGRSVGW